MRSKLTAIIAAAALAALSPTAASAAQGGTVDTASGDPQPQEDRDYPWGLLGLVGLLGLMPPKKHSGPIHVDNRANRS